MLDLAWVSARAGREWSAGPDLSGATAMAINSLYVLAVALIALALAARPWPLEVASTAALVLGGVMTLAGAAVATIGARPFGSSARLYGVDAGGLIEGGIYRFSRNPQYAGLVLLVAGIGVMARSGLALALSAAIAAGFWVWVVWVEEPHLEQIFGDRYRRYVAQVPRFVGLPARSSRP